jgi:hypothetical protein
MGCSPFARHLLASMAYSLGWSVNLDFLLLRLSSGNVNYFLLAIPINILSVALELF